MNKCVDLYQVLNLIPFVHRSVSIPWNNLMSVGTNSSLKVWWNSVLKQSGPGPFLVRMLLNTVSISLLKNRAISLFKLLTNNDLTLVVCIKNIYFF